MQAEFANLTEFADIEANSRPDSREKFDGLDKRYRGAQNWILDISRVRLSEKSRLIRALDAAKPRLRFATRKSV